MTAIDHDFSDLTDEQVDRLLDGGYEIAAAPEGYAGFAALVQTVTAPPTPSELAGEAAALAMFAAHRPVARPSRLKAKVAALVVVSGLGLTGVAAAANRLPAPVQDSVADVADIVGIQVPHSDNDAPAVPVTVPAGSANDTTPPSTVANPPETGGGTPVAPNADPNAQPSVPGAASSTASTPGATDPGSTVAPPATGNGGQTPTGDGTTTDTATTTGNGKANGTTKTDNGVGNGGIPGNGGQNPNKKP